MPTPLIVICSILLFIFLILILPVHLVVVLQGEDVKVFVRILFFKYTIVPERVKKEKTKKTKKEKVPKEKNKKKKKKKTQTSEPKLTLEEKITYITKLSKVLISKIKKHLIITLKELNIVIATDDAAKTAIVYGSVRGGLSALFAILHETMHFRISRKCKEVSMNFISNEMIIDFKLDFCVNIIKAFCILLPAAMEYIKIKSNDNEEEGDISNG